MWVFRYLLCAIFLFSRKTMSQVALPPGHERVTDNNCYDENRKAQKCAPEFVNAAYNLRVEATNTCGMYGPQEYCIQHKTVHGLDRNCHYCDARARGRSHPPEHMTDIDFDNKPNSRWQSETLHEALNWPSAELKVNLTLRLGKSFEITYVRIKFDQSPRPDSWAIYKKVREDGPWIPYQFYSSTCRDYYGLPDQNYIHGGSEDRPMCTSDHHDIVPISGAEIVFSTLEGRPSAVLHFEDSPQLQDWVTATDILIVLDRPNTFGDELFGDERVSKAYFYAISDFAVGGACKCNGHASECVWSTSEYPNNERFLVCQCEHNTGGPDCNECLPFYNDLPWKRAHSENAHECKACNCNNFSNRCFFDQKLYDETGHGGHCIDCSGNRDGPNCEKCKLNFYQRSDGYCIPCHCNDIGSRSLQCNSEGKCQCKPGVSGEKCDRCLANYYDFGQPGCKGCSCNTPGSFRNEPNCDTVTGKCECKENVEGQKCDKCKPGFFNLDIVNNFGCTQCFCYGHSSVCRSAPGYGQVLLESIFARGSERWTAEEGQRGPVTIQYNSATQNIEVKSSGREGVYFLAPDRFLGDQRGSYNQDLNFTLRIGEHSPKPSAEDLILEGAGLKISRPIFGQGNTLPSIQDKEFTFRLHEHPDIGWNPKLQARDFMSILANLTAIKIRGTYAFNGVGFLDNVKLMTARRGTAGGPAPWIEMCTCPEGYIGQFCESCTPGFTHEPKNGGPFARCVPCSCNGHAEDCDPESGQCICIHNTGGENCERCARGFYGNSLKGTDEDCKPCPCPNQGACIQLQDETIVCLECPTGYAGPQCEFCGDGFYGDPMGHLGEPTECQPCECNGNIDPNAVGNCNRTTGECIKCIYNTGGPKCDSCVAGYYGDALALPKGDCKFCECNEVGTFPTHDGKFVCEQPTGQCACKDNVLGRQCDTCREGHYDIASGFGCKECLCDGVGALNISCNVRTGNCNCRVGVVGLRCNECAPNHYGFSNDGCETCECDHIGSLSLQCDPEGQCPCRENVEGRACDRCKENKFNRQAGCVDCPACYNLIQEAVNSQRKKLRDMEKVLEEIANTPTVIDDSEFEAKLDEVQARVESLWIDSKSATGEDKSLLDKLKELNDKIKTIDETFKQTKISMEQGRINAEWSADNLTLAEGSVEMAQEALRNAQRFLDSDGKDAYEKAQEKSKEYGHQSHLMSELAKQARRLADDREDEMKEMEKIAMTAFNTSLEALNLAKGAHEQQRNISDDVRKLQQSTQSIEDETNVIHRRAEEALRVAKEAHNNALNHFQDASNQALPSIDLKAIKEQAQKAKAEAEKLKTSVEVLIAGREKLLKESQEEAMHAKEMLRNANNYQQRADELLADLDKAKASADESRNQSENVFKEAQKIHDTLQDFNRNVEESKVNAKAAKERIPEIQDLIQESETQTRENQRALAGAKVAASKALLDADEARSIAEKASEDADKIRGECGETKARANKLRDGALTLNTRVADTFSKLTEVEEKIGEEDKQVRGALEKASEAQSTAKDAHEKVEKALNTVRDIAITLKNLDNINEEGLDNLEQKISEVEEELRKAGLDEKIETLRTARNKQILWIKNYEDELEMLRKEVENVQEIQNSLPPADRCWKRTRLEP